MNKKVSDTYCKNIKKPGMHAIGHGLYLRWYSGEKGQSNCRESGRCSAVIAATIPVKKASAKRVSRGWCFYTVTVSAFWSSIDRFRRIDSPFSSSLYEL